LNYIFNIIHARNRVKLTFSDLEIRKHLKPIVLLALSVVASSLYNKVNVTMLGLLCPEEIVAFYTNANKVVFMVLTLVTAISGVFMPRLSYMYAYDRKQFSDLITLGAKIVLFLAVPCCAGLLVVAKNAVQVLFGDQFLPSVPAMQILSVLVVIIGVCDLLCYQAIISSGNEKLLIRSRVVAGVANIVLNTLLIPQFQHVGAAMATVASELIVNGMLIKHAYAIARPKIPARYLVKLVIGAIIMGVCVLRLQLLIESPVLALLCSVCVGLVLYIVIEVAIKNEVLFMLRLRRKSDADDIIL
jgi:O-antigen/teichoic acid export membrane protein